MLELWVEAYRPKTLNDYVFQNSDQQTQFQSWVNAGSIPHILLTGPAGTGKTSAAKMLINELNLNPLDVLEINASSDNRIEVMRERIINFASTRPFGDLKVILLDEADYLTPSSQAALRGTMEQFHETCRFILTGNYANKIIPALHSRCHSITLDRLDITEFTARAATILVTENVEFDLELLDTYVRANYPDMRKCVNSIQMNSREGHLRASQEKSASSSDYLISAVELLKKRNLREARKLICSNFRSDEVESLYRWMYDNLDLWSSDENAQDQAIVIIRKALINSRMVADQEINLSACLVELANIEN
jgi:DNA polymerase III delta prime subunit